MDTLIEESFFRVNLAIMPVLGLRFRGLVTASPRGAEAEERLSRCEQGPDSWRIQK